MRVEHIQGSELWHNWRSEGIGASQAAAIMGESPFSSPLQLWEEKTGRRTPFQGNDASRRGQELEPEARMYYNMVSGSNMQPACYQHDEFDFIRASLDGISEDGKTILEIKCHGLKVHSEVVASNQPPAYYYAQKQQGMLCSGAKNCVYMAYNPDHAIKAVFIDIPRDEEYIAKLIKEETDFWNLVQNDVPPESSVTEYIEVNEPGFDIAARVYMEAKNELKIAKMNEAACKTAVLDFGDDSNFKGAGILIARVVRKGAIDLAKLQKDYDISNQELEKYRKAETSYWKISEEK